MPRLTDTKIKSITSVEKLTKLSDGLGLYLEIRPPAVKTFRIAYRIKVGDDVKQRLYTVGKYPLVSLAQARKKVLDVKELIAQGIDPVAHNKRQKVIQKATTFKEVAQEYLNMLMPKVTRKRVTRINGLLNNHIYPTFEKLDIKNISRNDILTLGITLDKYAAKTVADDALTLIKNVLDYAADKGITDYSVYSSSIKKHITKHVEKHHPHVPLCEVPELLHAIEQSNTKPKTLLALKLMILLFPRVSEFRFAEWDHINFDDGTWFYPSQNMKGLLHLKKSNVLDRKIMLSTQAITLLKKLHKMTGKHRYLFPSQSSKDGVMSNATMLRVLNRLGYQNRQDIHGFRGLASTWMNENYPEQEKIIEKCLAHKGKDRVQRAYDHANLLKAQQKLWQDYGDWLVSQGLKI